MMGFDKLNQGRKVKHWSRNEGGKTIRRFFFLILGKNCMRDMINISQSKSGISSAFFFVISQSICQKRLSSLFVSLWRRGKDKNKFLSFL